MVDKARLQHAEQMGGHWLSLGNRAEERGAHDLAERHYAKHRSGWTR